MSVCGSCGAEIRWVTTVDDARMPIDPLPVQFAAAKMVALNPRTQRAKVLTQDDLVDVERWRQQGAIVYRSHWETCATAEQHRVHPEQEALAL